MDDKLRFFDSTFRVLVILALCAWALLAMFVLFGTDSGGCNAGPAWIFDALALTAGVLTAPPLVYGLIRLLFWPRGLKSPGLGVAGWAAAIGIGIFIVAVILLTIVISQLGCS